MVAVLLWLHYYYGFLYYYGYCITKVTQFLWLQLLWLPAVLPVYAKVLQFIITHVVNIKCKDVAVLVSATLDLSKYKCKMLIHNWITYVEPKMMCQMRNLRPNN